MLVNNNFNNNDKYALKTEIPTSLPANGGNADTVDGYHIRCEDVATSNYNWFATFDNDGLSGINPERAYVGNAGNAASANCVKTLSVIGTASDCTHNTILEWANSIDGFGTACIIVAYGYPSDLPVQQEGLITVETCYQKSRKIITFTSYTDTGLMYQRMIYNNEWRYDWCQTKAGNADTLDGLHASDFAKSVSPRITGDMIFENDTNQNTINAIYSANDNLVFRNITKDRASICDLVIGNDGVRIANSTQNFKIGDGGNADTLDGLHATAFMRYEVDKSLTTSINDMLTPGTYGVYDITPDFPTGYGVWGLLEVHVYGSICYQIIRFETGTIINRAKIVEQTEWSEWSIANANNAAPIPYNHNLNLTTIYNQPAYSSYNNDGGGKGLWFINHTSSNVTAVIAAVAPAGAGPTFQYGYGTGSYPEIQDTGNGREWFTGMSLGSSPRSIQLTVPPHKLGYFGIYGCSPAYPAYLYGLHFMN